MTATDRAIIDIAQNYEQTWIRPTACTQAIASLFGRHIPTLCRILPKEANLRAAYNARDDEQAEKLSKSQQVE